MLMDLPKYILKACGPSEPNLFISNSKNKKPPSIIIRIWESMENSTMSQIPDELDDNG